MSVAPPSISLSALDRMVSGMVGLARNASARRMGRALEAGRTDLGIGRDVVGAMAELAVARHTGRHWEPIAGALDTDRGDVSGYQVKAITRPSLSLLLRGHDPAQMAYILCLVSLDRVTLLGWAWGVDVKQPQWWRERNMHRPCYAYPQARLASVETLP